MINNIKQTAARLLHRRYLKKRLGKLKKAVAGGRIILLNVPSHGNLGDHLISLAEQKLVEDITGNKPILITSADLYYAIDIVKEHINDEDILLITGGGYLGSIWPVEEERINDLVLSLPKNKIIIMPQTIFYDSDDESQKLCIMSSHIYNNHRDFILTVREQNSLNIAFQYLKLSQSRVRLLPDMALYLNYSNTNKMRHGIILCMRNDKEKNDNSQLDDIVYSSVRNYDCTYLDTQAGHSINQSLAKEEISQLICKFQAAELVITDRLHGMLYATICGTPVIALDNSSHKVKNVYDCWLKDFDFVRFVDNPNSFEEAFKQLIALGGNHFSSSLFHNQLLSFFKPLISK